MAKEASGSGRDSPWLPPASDFKSLWRMEMRTITINEIKDQGTYKGKRYCELNSNMNLTPWYRKFRLPRRSVVGIYHQTKIWPHGPEK